MAYREMEIKFHSLVEECVSKFEDWNSSSLDELNAFLKIDSSCINQKYSYGGHGPRTALNRVLIDRKCPMEIVRLLLNYGANANCIDFVFSSALSNAVRCQGFDIVQLFIFAGAKIGKYSAWARRYNIKARRV